VGCKIVTDQPFTETQRWIELLIPDAETGLALYTPEGHENRIGQFQSIAFWCDDVFATARTLKIGLAGSFGVSATSVPPDGRQARLKQSVLDAPLRFEANQGQTDPRVRFVSRGPGYTMLLSASDAILNLRGGPVRMSVRRITFCVR
jgi:hypothetical protein